MTEITQHIRRFYPLRSVLVDSNGMQGIAIKENGNPYQLLHICQDSETLIGHLEWHSDRDGYRFEPSNWTPSETHIGPHAIKLLREVYFDYLNSIK